MIDKPRKTTIKVTMQPRHFRFVARVIADLPNRDVANAVAILFARAFAEDNPGFKRDEFMRACGSA